MFQAGALRGGGKDSTETGERGANQIELHPYLRLPLPECPVLPVPYLGVRGENRSIEEHE